DFNVSHMVDQVRDWYNGYTFGKKTIYNPWSISKKSWIWPGTRKKFMERFFVGASPLLCPLSIRKRFLIFMKEG
ncbi:MAG TPA: AAA family ATPase, partial [Candidatus Kapabacteria bacterium]|nr:AAA family ATPase [Candidatus Kapabacteria bacterium]